MLDKLPTFTDELEYVLDLVKYDVLEIPALYALLEIPYALDLVNAVVLDKLPTLTDELEYVLDLVKYDVLEIPAFAAAEVM